MFINELNKIYKEGNLIPFIGAGLSIPYSIPDWGTLIRECAISMGIEDIDGKKTSFLPMLDYSLGKYDYWEAVRIIKNYLLRTDDDIQEYIVQYINENIPKDFEDIDNNYIDLAKYNFNIFLTTNYDHIFNNYLDTNYVPINLKDINQNVQKIVNDRKNKRVFHLHGSLSDTSSIVISEDKYKELYDNEKYKMLFSAITSSKTFLFMGFSFNDVFIQKIIADNNEFFKSKHYILLDNPEIKVIRELKEKYNIETIKYNSNDSSHCEEIRKILKKICENISIDISMSSPIKKDVDEDLLEKVPDKSTKKKLESNTFCKKLRLEDIGDTRVDYSKDCFFIAERYFRGLEKMGLSKSDSIANHLLDLAYLTYKEVYMDKFEDNHDSNELLKETNKELKKLDYPRLQNIFNHTNMPTSLDKQGFIHILADDIKSEKEVWWGEKRFE